MPPAPRETDVAIIGGGPAGAAVGTLVARAGHRVALFERRPFPRFHVGESLIPAVNLTLERLGVLDDMDRLGFPRKYGVQFYSSGRPARPFYFSEAGDPRLHRTWQVRRSEFDALLLDNAERAGVRVATPAPVVGLLESAGAVRGVRVAGQDGSEHDVEARVVVDASGQKGTLARRLGRRAHLSGLQNVAVYAHYREVERDTGIDAASTLVYRLDRRSWLWFIPLADVVSIGLVAPAREVSARAAPPAAVLDEAIASCAPLRARLAAAERATEVLVERDFSYRARRDGGAGWMLVGDALGFIDPMYSSGLFLTMLSAELAAAAAARALERPGRADFAGFSADYQAAFDQFLALVRAFYSPGFHFGELSRDPEHRRGLVDLLTGDVRTPRAREVARAVRAMCV